MLAKGTASMVIELASKMDIYVMNDANAIQIAIARIEASMALK